MIAAILSQQYPGMVREFVFHPERKWRFDYVHTLFFICVRSV